MQMTEIHLNDAGAGSRGSKDEDDDEQRIASEGRCCVPTTQFRNVMSISGCETIHLLSLFSDSTVLWFSFRRISLVDVRAMELSVHVYGCYVLGVS